ncbi:MAG: hypothetical protein JNM81_08585 [Rhodospirillaceae bacterium]|nr:hypothetical protein [Rhodospirillaceae bacterium]
MDWFLSIFDRFLAAAFVAVFAVAASQAGPFATQYAARTATQLAQAQAHLKDVQSGVRYQTMAPTVRAELEAQAKADLAARSATHTAIAEAIPLVQPYALWRYGDETVIGDTWRLFVPALPLSFGMGLSTFLGAIIGFALYELLKFPIAAILRAPPRRRFKKR